MLSLIRHHHTALRELQSLAPTSLQVRDKHTLAPSLERSIHHTTTSLRIKQIMMRHFAHLSQHYCPSVQQLLVVYLSVTKLDLPWATMIRLAYESCLSLNL